MHVPVPRDLHSTLCTAPTSFSNFHLSLLSHSCLLLCLTLLPYSFLLFLLGLTFCASTVPAISVTAMCPGRLPSGTRTDVTAIDIPFAMTSSCPRVTCLWPLSPEVWSEDFVPPNVNLDPCDLQNGEVCCSRRYLPQSATTSVLPPEFDFTNGRGSNCGVQQQQQPTARVDGGEPPWINC